MKIIPLNSRTASQEFSVTLNNHNLRFTINWMTRYEYFRVDIHDLDENPIVLGRAMHSGINLLTGLNTKIGQIILEGETPTIDNLGVSNQLKWYPL